MPQRILPRGEIDESGVLEIRASRSLRFGFSLECTGFMHQYDRTAFNLVPIGSDLKMARFNAGMAQRIHRPMFC